LDAAGSIWAEKTIVAKRPHTQVSLAEQGKWTVKRHWQPLEALRRQASEID
jgi:hypothetical protein